MSFRASQLPGRSQAFASGSTPGLQRGAGLVRRPGSQTPLPPTAATLLVLGPPVAPLAAGPESGQPLWLSPGGAPEWSWCFRSRAEGMPTGVVDIHRALDTYPRIRKAGPHRSLSPLSVPRTPLGAQHSAGPHVGWIGGGWRYRVGTLQLVNPRPCSLQLVRSWCLKVGVVFGSVC